MVRKKAKGKHAKISADGRESRLDLWVGGFDTHFPTIPDGVRVTVFCMQGETDERLGALGAGHAEASLMVHAIFVHAEWCSLLTMIER